MTGNVGYRKVANIVHPHVSRQFETAEDLYVDISQNYINEPLCIRADQAPGMFVVSPIVDSIKSITSDDSITLVLYADFSMATSVFQEAVDAGVVPMVFINSSSQELSKTTIVEAFVNADVDIAKIAYAIHRFISNAGLYIAIMRKNELIPIPNVYDFSDCK